MMKPTLRKTAGAALLTLVFGALFIMVASSSVGLNGAALAFGFSIVGTAIIVFAVYLLTK
jgi:hypothetical protein